jgi:hypothetical protein
MTDKKSLKNMVSAGSALILAVVLTSLLAIIGTIFLMSARVERMATSAIAENKELNYAVDTVVAKISQVLVSDVPGAAGQPDYYNYPDGENAWLASLEPDLSGRRRWRQISDIYGKFEPRDRELIFRGKDSIIPDYQDPETVEPNEQADADGDGVADSLWIELDDMTSSKGRPIYAAIRIIDNGGMLNVNTAYKFDANATDPNLIDGSNQTQINLFALSKRGTSNTITQLDDERYGSEPHNLNDYIRDVVWRYNEPNGAYTPFDISDELELRNRFTLNRTDVDGRIEEVWTSAFQGPSYLYTPVDSNLSNWLQEVYYNWSDPNAAYTYSYRHIGTTYNIDRIIDPNGDRMVNINDANVRSIYDAIINANLNIANVEPNVEQVAAQIAANIVDFRDNDSNVTAYINPDDGVTYYGFEQPCIYISELAHRFVPSNPTVPGSPIHRSYAVELYKPYPGDNDPNGWQLVVGGSTIPIDNWIGSEQFYVIQDQNLSAPLDVASGAAIQNATFAFTDNTEIRLERPVSGGVYVIVDRYVVDPNIPDPWLFEDNFPHSIQRDISPHKCIRRSWDSTATAPTLGRDNSYSAGGEPIQAHPANRDFTNVGEIGMVFRKGAYYIDPADRDERIGYGTNTTEAEVRVNLTDIGYDNLFQYLTVFDPGTYPWNDPNEVRVKGRININTAPWFVIAQLPWMRYGDSTPFERAKAICDYRDNTLHGFENIGELMQVTEMRSLVSDGLDNLNSDTPKGPDLTDDTARDDFEERDVIFARISNLVTVRSDVFTAYILVRIGSDGPQKRVMAIFDRSNVYSPTDKVRIVALHPVPDPR